MTRKHIREIVYQKYDGHCAYCGAQISIRKMQVDHIVQGRGSNEISNLNPSCARCNKWKGAWSVEEFRNVIETSLDRLDRDTPHFRLAKDYKLIMLTSARVKFYFEYDII